MKRSPMKRGKGLRSRSKKRESVYAGSAGKEGRRAFVARILKERPDCQARFIIGKYEALYRGKATPAGLGKDGAYLYTHSQLMRAAQCTLESVDVHEILARSAGGSILDEENVLSLCRSCHSWIGDNPKEALALGLRKSRYEGRNPVKEEIK